MFFSKLLKPRRPLWLGAAVLALLNALAYTSPRFWEVFAGHALFFSVLALWDLSRAEDRDGALAGWTLAAMAAGLTALGYGVFCGDWISAAVSAACLLAAAALFVRLWKKSAAQGGDGMSQANK